MLQDFRQCLYTDFIFGKDSEKCIGEELKKLGAHTVLVHHDSGKFLYDTGLLENVKKYPVSYTHLDVYKRQLQGRTA